MISPLVGRGFGTFGGARFLPTRGFTSGLGPLTPSPPPAYPASLRASATATSLTSLDVLIQGTSGNTSYAYAQQLDAPDAPWVSAAGVFGNGTVSFTGLSAGGSYWGFAVNGTDGGGCFGLPVLWSVSLAQPDTIIASVVAKFNASPTLLSLVPSGLWNTEVPEGTDLPYAFVLLLSTRYRHQFEHKRVEQARVAIYTFARGAQEASAIAAQIQKEFDWATDFPFSDESGIYFMKCQPQTFRLESAMARWKDGSLVYQSEVGYEIWVAR